MFFIIQLVKKSASKTLTIANIFLSCKLPLSNTRKIAPPSFVTSTCKISARILRKCRKQLLISALQKVSADLKYVEICFFSVFKLQPFCKQLGFFGHLKVSALTEKNLFVMGFTICKCVLEFVLKASRCDEICKSLKNAGLS